VKPAYDRNTGELHFFTLQACSISYRYQKSVNPICYSFLSNIASVNTDFIKCKL